MAAKKITAVNNRVLDVDLTTQEMGEIRVSETDRRLYLGGKGLALKLLHDTIAPGADPLGPDNVMVIMSGPTAGTKAPSGGRFAVVSKSPLTGIFCTSLSGGKFGLSLKRAGFDGIIIRGRASGPVLISVEEGGAKILDAADSWGMDTYEFQDAKKELGDWVVAGPAGENLVRYAVLVAGRRVAGRGGMGAVFGSKNLKGIAARGKARIVPAKPKAFEKAVTVAARKVRNHEKTGHVLMELGTPLNVRLYGPNNIMPVRNYKKARFEQMEDISGETIRDKHFVKRHGCTGCSIRCGRTGRYNDKVLVSPEYETIALMGSNLEIGSLDHIAEFNDVLNRLGMDTISCGNTLGFAMELSEKGLLDSPLSFGETDGILEMLGDIAHRRGLGDDMANGVRATRTFLGQ